MKLRFTEAAKKDYQEAKSWYEEIDPDLGSYFEATIDEALGRVKNNPMQYQEISGDTRKTVILKFPYNLFYLISDNTIVITALLHHRRDPEQWKR
ncbi:type II toxin-antitoxin system RelE/ParE family toxin [Gracilimonas mengyeensis]|uniref:Plasmid stabilization system protein ParE n=1 Tax=Gracilimonas mengyeensis TaxID=1302730 RepID=A0A521DD30_9BACT|nr:type II toxin-antitoxin system RelE/ParE family toxin [Gracilimonas mengyeensis]SMO69573.1 Plasmid stabilization system protein ParE [Gracilimonas mengyeensis]